MSVVLPAFHRPVRRGNAAAGQVAVPEPGGVVGSVGKQIGAFKGAAKGEESAYVSWRNICWRAISRARDRVWRRWKPLSVNERHGGPPVGVKLPATTHRGGGAFGWRAILTDGWGWRVGW
jgi:hypothetical protein